MPYANNDGVRIYYEREGSGPPIVLHCGYSLTLQNWRQHGYVAALREDYELLLLDPRGQGRSDKPHDPAHYTFEKRVADVVAVLEDARIARPIFWGYSMGGQVGYAIGPYAPGRFRALVIGGSQPEAGDPAGLYQRAATLRSVGMAGFLAIEEGKYGTFSAPTRAGILANDAEALAAASIALAEAPSLATVSLGERCPVLIYVGERDAPYRRAEEVARGKPGVMFAVLPGLNHSQVNTRLEVRLPPVQAFLASIEMG